MKNCSCLPFQQAQINVHLRQYWIFVLSVAAALELLTILADSSAVQVAHSGFIRASSLKTAACCGKKQG